MYKTINSGLKLRELAALGARQRIAQIQEELYAMHREFPEIFPSGVPIITPLDRKPVNNKKKAAKALVKKAKKLAAPRVIPPPDPNAEIVTAKEAIDIIGMTEPAFYIQVKKGKIPVYCTNEKGHKRFLKSDIGAFAADYNSQKPAPEPEPEAVTV